MRPSIISSIIRFENSEINIYYILIIPDYCYLKMYFFFVFRQSLEVIKMDTLKVSVLLDQIHFDVKVHPLTGVVPQEMTTHQSQRMMSCRQDRTPGCKEISLLISLTHSSSSLKATGTTWIIMASTPGSLAGTHSLTLHSKNKLTPALQDTTEVLTDAVVIFQALEINGLSLMPE